MHSVAEQIREETEADSHLRAFAAPSMSFSFIHAVKWWTSMPVMIELTFIECLLKVSNCPKCFTYVTHLSSWIKLYEIGIMTFAVLETIKPTQSSLPSNTANMLYALLTARMYLVKTNTHINTHTYAHRLLEGRRRDANVITFLFLVVIIQS